MTAEELHIAELRRTLDAIAKTKSPRLTVDYGKHITRQLKELAEYRKWRERHESTEG